MNVTFSKADNPFATRSVRPGAIEFLFPAGVDADALVARLEKSNWFGQIVGPHGGGKSTLLAAILPSIERAGREPTAVALHDGERRLPPELRDGRHWNARTQIVVDGYEQLGRVARILLLRRCRRMGCGLLVTAHSDVGLPEIYRVEPTLETVQNVVERLLGGRWKVISPDDLARAWVEHPGDVRETLFALYDLYERRRA